MTAEEYRNQGINLLEGIGCEADRDAAIEAFRKGAEGNDVISAVNLGAIAYDEEKYREAVDWWSQAFAWYKAHPDEGAKEFITLAHSRLGDMYFYNYMNTKPVPDDNLRLATLHYSEAKELGDMDVCNELGMCYYGNHSLPNGSADVAAALRIWQEGMAVGNHECAIHYCAHFIDNNQVDPEIVDLLEELVRDEDDPCADACALLYKYYSQEGNEELAADWMECGMDMGSELLQNMLEEEREEEIGEDSWTRSESMEDEAELCVIIVDTDGAFRIKSADATDWRSLPTLIHASGTNDLRCSKFNEVSRRLRLKGNLLGLLDREAFRKPDLKLNHRASQWYDGYADLSGDMIICLEDSRHNPFSFASRAEAQRVIDTLRGA